MENLRRAVRTLDLSEVPPALVDDVGLESALLLKEVLDRIELPQSGTIPGDDDPSPPQKWTVPETEITIARLETGPRAGEYLFTAETVRRVHEFYERAKHLPYQPAASEGFYELYVFAPGWMIPYRWIEALPAWLGQGYHEQARWQWLALGLVAARRRRDHGVGPERQASARWDDSGVGWSRLLFPVDRDGRDQGRQLFHRAANQHRRRDVRLHQDLTRRPVLRICRFADHSTVQHGGEPGRHIEPRSAQEHRHAPDAREPAES